MDSAEPALGMHTTIIDGAGVLAVRRGAAGNHREKAVVVSVMFRGGAWADPVNAARTECETGCLAIG